MAGFFSSKFGTYEAEQVNSGNALPYCSLGLPSSFHIAVSLCFLDVMSRVLSWTEWKRIDYSESPFSLKQKSQGVLCDSPVEIVNCSHSKPQLRYCSVFINLFT